MERGLLWLPLLIAFGILAWAGWNEYQKIEAYKAWAQQFQHAKFDVRAVLGQNGEQLIWGKPTRQGPIDLKTLSLRQVQKIDLRVNGQPADINAPPAQARRITLGFQLQDSDQSLVEIPFTEISLAVEWSRHLQKFLSSPQTGQS